MDESTLSRRGYQHQRLCAAALALGLFAGGVRAAEPLTLAMLSHDLSELGLDELMQIEITSVSMRAEPLGQAAAAVYVLTGDELRRAGIQSLVEALRLVPGLHVARIGDINTHVVSSRGFSDRLSDKLEVLVDGRSVYTPLFSGVFWDTLDTFLPDVERIEVIRGPGATLWGTNAINGVINIVTRSASETRGQSLQLSAGNELKSRTALRSGHTLGRFGDVRLYAQQSEQDGLRSADGSDSYNVMRNQMAGFRSDSKPAADQTLTLAGEHYRGQREDPFQFPVRAGNVETSGSHLRGQWNWQAEANREWQVQALYDRSKRLIPTTVFRENRDLARLGLHHRWQLGRHTLLAGGHYARSSDETGEGPPYVFIFVPSAEKLHFYGAFVQDQIALDPKLELTIGSKFEHNDYTGWQAQPNLRLGWAFRPGWFSWLAASRAMRIPNRLDHDSATFSPALRTGNPEQKPERLHAYEGGLRFYGRPALSADLALFYNDYDDLRSSEAAVPVPRYGNGIQGHSYGAELALAWQPFKGLELRPAFSLLRLQLQSKPGSSDTSTAAAFEDQSPRQQASLRLDWQPLPRWGLHGFLRHVGAVDRHDAEGPVQAYTELNLRLAWQARKGLELALVGENLLDDQHGEFRTVINTAFVEVERAARLELSWTWD